MYDAHGFTPQERSGMEIVEIAIRHGGFRAPMDVMCRWLVVEDEGYEEGGRG